MTIKASEIEEFLQKIKYHKTSLNRDILENTERKLLSYLNKSFTAIDECNVARDDNSADEYTLRLSTEQEEEVRQEMQNTINLFGNDW